MPTPTVELEEMMSAILHSICTKTPEPLIRFDGERFVVQVNPEDQGRCVGKNGIAIWAVSAILWWAGTAQFGTPITYHLMEPLGGRSQPKPRVPFKLNPKWDRLKIRDLIDRILTATFKDKIPFAMEDVDDECQVSIALPKYLSTSMSDPDLAEAITVILSISGFCHGAVINTVVTWQ